MRVTALIMAGGKGERFWPRSRVNRPKQFIDVTGCGKTMIQLTVERILPLTEPENVYVVTNEMYHSLVREQLPYIPEKNILCEPAARNTAPCIGLGAIYSLRSRGDSVMMVLPSDHLIKYPDLFRKALQDGIGIAEHGQKLVTIGIMPDCPETGYGYIKKASINAEYKAWPVERFVEKPDRETAEKYLASGEYFWNSGMFIWKASTFLSAMERYMPDVYKHLINIKESIGSLEEHSVLQEEFLEMRSESVDYGIMEKAEDIYVIPGKFGWDDVGSWLAVERIKERDENRNVISGNVIETGTSNCIIEASDKLIAAVGLQGIVVVDSEDVTLIGAKEHMGDIKKVLEKIRQRGNSGEYL